MRWQKQRIAAAVQSPLGCVVACMSWLALFMIVFLAIGGHHGNRLLHFGPSELLYFFTVHINTWARWFWLMVFVVVDAAIQAWSATIMTPWLTNSVYAQSQDGSGGVAYLTEYRHGATMFVTSVYQLWASVRQFLPFYLAFTQLDILAVRVVAEVLVSTATGWAAIREKRLASHLISLDGQMGDYYTGVDEYDPNDRSVGARVRHWWRQLRWWMRPAPGSQTIVVGAAVSSVDMSGSVRSLTDSDHNNNEDLLMDLPRAFLK